VSNGALQVGSGGAGQTGTGTLTVTSGATLLGTGTVRASNATFASNATVRPGDSVADSSHGVLTFTPIGIGTYNFQSGSKIIMGISTATSTDMTFGGNNVGTVGYNSYVDGITGVGSHDKLVFNGTAGSTLAFSGSLSVLPSNYTAQVGDVFNLMDWSALISTDFSGFDVGANYRDGSGDNGSQFDLPDLTSSPGLVWDVSRFTTSGNIVVVPEPGRALLLGCGLLSLLMLRRRPFPIV
jgi:hypothetical protein